jgi:hypothetical protein
LQQKLSGKKKRIACVQALKKVLKNHARDMATIESLKTSNNPEDWEDIIWLQETFNEDRIK